MYTLHIGNKNYSSWSLRAWILMRERDIAFTERLHVFGSGFNAREEARSPAGKVPCLWDGERVVWDSLAIAEYLAERHPGVWPQDPGERAWARCAAAEMHSGFAALRSDCAMNCGVRMRLQAGSDALAHDIARVDALWREGLARSGGPFLCGAEFGAVDAFYCPVAFRWQTYGFPLSAPARAYAERLLALPGMRAWYEAALAEPYRDAEHEGEAPGRAELVEDLRRAGTPAPAP